MAFSRIVDTTGHPGSSRSGTTPPLPDRRGYGPLRSSPWLDFQPWGTEQALFLRQSDMTMWAASSLTQSDLNLSADTVYANPSTALVLVGSWQETVLLAHGFTLAPA